MKLQHAFLLTLLQVAIVTPGLVSAEDPLRIKIGISTALTGDVATYGSDMRDFMIFANEKIAGNRYKLVFEDDRCSGKEAVTAAHKLIDVEKVSYVTGFPCSGAALAALPLYEKAGVLSLVAFASSPRIADGGDFVFRTFPGDLEAASLLFSYMKDRHLKIGVLSEQTEYAQDFKAVLLKLAGKEGKAIETEDFISQNADLRTNVLNLKKRGVDALFINPQAESAFVTILKAMQDLKFEVPVYGAYWPGSPSLLKTTGERMEGVVFVDSPALSQVLNSEGMALYKEYSQRFGEIRSTEAAFASAFEAFRVLHLAIQSGRDPRRFLYETKFDGIFGPYSFDEKGEIKGFSLVMKRIRNGLAELIM